MAGRSEEAFREAVFTWLESRLLTADALTRDQLSEFELDGRRHRLVGTQTGIWKVKAYSDAAISIVTAYVPPGHERPYEDTLGHDGLLRYKWRGTNPDQADNIALRRAMERKLPLVWFVGIGHAAGSSAQVFVPRWPVWLVGEERSENQFVVAVDQDQKGLPQHASPETIELTRRHNERLVKVRHHQPLFRTTVLRAYQRQCAVCKLPFPELLDAAHIIADSAGGPATLQNGLALCKIHHGAFDANIIGIDPDLTIRVKASVLDTFDGPTLQHSIKEMHGERLRQLPVNKSDHPDRDLLAARFDHFLSKA